MNTSTNYLAMKINALQDYLASTDNIRCRTHHVKNHIYKCYYFYDSKTRKRHEHYADSSAGKALEKTFLKRTVAQSQLTHFQKLWDTNSCLPVPRLDLPALRASKKSIITKDFFDSLIPCSNPKPILHPNPYKGITFRSKSEREIAEILDELGIEYKYEPAIPVNDYEIYADFVCFIRELGIGFIIEHCGLMDSAGYIDKTIRSFRDYVSLGLLPSVDVLFTYEKNATPPTSAYFRTQINRLLDTLCVF